MIVMDAGLWQLRLNRVWSSESSQGRRPVKSQAKDWLLENSNSKRCNEYGISADEMRNADFSKLISQSSHDEYLLRMQPIPF